MSKESDFETQGGKNQHQVSAVKQLELGLVAERNKPMTRANIHASGGGIIKACFL